MEDCQQGENVGSKKFPFDEDLIQHSYGIYSPSPEYLVACHKDEWRGEPTSRRRGAMSRREGGGGLASAEFRLIPHRLRWGASFFRFRQEFGGRFFFPKAPGDISYQGLSSDWITFVVISLNLRSFLPLCSFRNFFASASFSKGMGS